VAGPAGLLRSLALAAAGVAAATLHLPVTSAAQGVTSTARPVTFRDVAAAWGLRFKHTNGASAERFFPEVMGSGGLFFDADNDGWLDVLLVDGGSIADPAVARRAQHRLYLNTRSGAFEDVTATSGIAHRGYGMGACAGDVDNDGLVDLYITTVGPNLLYRNRGSGRFSEVPNAGGASGEGWSTSCAFVDVDRDGYLDLFVTDYVDAPPDRNRFCGVAGPPPIRDYCHPLVYPPRTSALYRNTGRGTFADVSAASGIAGHRGNGLGVAVSDVDDDGWPDVFVANDSMPNFLFRNERNGTFSERAGMSGVAVSVDGKAKAGMGTAFGDFAGTGALGLVVTNHETEMHSLFLNTGGAFSDVTLRSGLGAATRRYVGFGVAFLDYDNDTRLDIAIANGHVMANAPELRAGARYAQRNLLFRNAGATFVDVTPSAGPGFAIELVSRTLAAGDIDNDGDVDLLVTNNGAAPNLLLNDGGNAANALILRLVGEESNRSAIGARLVLTVGRARFVREVQSGSSYLGQNDLRVHVGLGLAARADRLEIRWPSGRTETIDSLVANHIVSIREGRGVVERTRFRRQP
jgi:hypothetical protein